jgi:ion channel-forming bestrophin family protein
VLLNKRIPILFLLKKVRIEFLVIALISISISLLDANYFFFSIPFSAVTILGTLISLLLAFRTAQAYDRWWEARKIWGKILSEARSITREALCFFKSSESNKPETLAKRQIAWNYELGDTLRGKKNFDRLSEYISAEELAYVKGHMNSPNALLDLHAKQIRDAYAEGLINEFQQIHLMNTVSDLCDLMGMSERIKTTVFPKTYSTLLHLSIYVFAIMLPFGLKDFSLTVEIMINIVLSVSFFLIERTAVYLQDPFEDRPTDVSVTAIARVIEINILEMLAEKQKPELIASDDFYIM